MRLGEILNKIFRKRNQPGVEKRQMAEDIYKPLNEHRVDESSRFKKVEEHILAEQIEKKKSWREKLQSKNINIVMAVIVVASTVLVALLAVLFVRLANSSFKEENVITSITGPEKIAVGDKISYEVVVENKNRIKLNDVTLQIKLPNNFILQNNSFIVDRNLSGAKIVIGEMKGHSKKQYKLDVVVGYADDQQMVLKTIVKYQPDNVSSYFQVDTAKNINSKKIDLNIFVSTAETVSSGELLAMDVIIKNDSNDDFKDIVLKIDYPEGFVYEKSSKEVLSEKNNKWLIDGLNRGEQRKITIAGRLNGQLDVIKKFKIFLLRNQHDETILTKTEKSLKIVPSKVLLRQVVNNKNVSPGDYLQYKILFKNNSTTPLHNLVLKTYLPEKYIDRNSVDIRHGYYDSRDNVITWKAADINQLSLLEPGEEGNVVFRVRVQDKILPKDRNDKNFYTLAHSEIESLDVDSPIFENKKIMSNKLKVPINSAVSVVARASYLPTESDNSKMDNVLRVDKKTFIKVQFSIYNTTSRLKDVKLVADLPSGTKWERQIFPSGDNLKFDINSNKLEWRLGIVDVGTGFISPPEKAEFIISVTPSANQTNYGIDLINNILLRAKDMFSGNGIGYELKSITSEATDGLELGVVQK
jgi:uncharacterized repeat protein (TIGR01451 family)